MTRSEEYMMMKTLRAQGWSIKDIATELNCDRKTVRKWLNSNELPQYKRDIKPPSKLEPFKEYIVNRMTEGCFNAVVIFDEIVDQGYTGRMTILRDFMRTHREPARAKASIRFETPPGKQAQVDWGEVAAVDLGDRIHKFYAFVMIMGHSRYEYVEFTENMKLDTLIGCHERAFKFFGGIPETIVYDNMRTVVNRGNKSGNEKWNKKFFHFALHHGFTLHRCRPYHPRSKGKVENGVKYVKQNFWPRVRTITGLADLNRQVFRWLDQTCNVRIHQTTREQPKLAFQREVLKPMNPEPFLANYLHSRKVMNDCTICYETSTYSVPFKYVGLRVGVKDLKNGTLEIYSETGERIAIHEKSAVRYGKIRNKKHFEGLLNWSQKRIARTAPTLIPDNPPKVHQRPLTVYDSLVSEVSS